MLHEGGMISGARFKRLERKLSKGFSQDSLFLLPTFWVDVVNSYWLAPTHARLAHISPQNFKRP
jgi:hypothetical protein